MQKSKTLIEWHPLQYEAKLITEARKAGQPVIVPALLQRADTPNSNGRIYPRGILEREVNKYQSIIDQNMALGELDHPETDPVVNLKNAAIAIKGMSWNGNDLMGEVEILHRVDAGRTILGLMEHGINIGISSRGVGSTIQNESGQELVDDDYTLLCFDVVSIGSVDGAGLLREGRVNLAESFSMDHYNMKLQESGIYTMTDENAPLRSILNDILGK